MKTSYTKILSIPQYISPRTPSSTTTTSTTTSCPPILVPVGDYNGQIFYLPFPYVTIVFFFNHRKTKILWGTCQFIGFTLRFLIFFSFSKPPKKKQKSNKVTFISFTPMFVSWRVILHLCLLQYFFVVVGYRVCFKTKIVNKNC